MLDHPFFKSLDIEKLEKYLLPPPFKPDLGSQLDVKYFNAKQTEKDLTETYVPEAKTKKVEKLQDQFKDFDFKPKGK